MTRLPESERRVRPSRLEIEEPSAQPESYRESGRVSRRAIVQALAAASVGGTVFQRALAAQVEETQGVVDGEMIKAAEWIAGVTLTEEQREQAASAVKGVQDRIARIRKVEVGYETAPAMQFSVLSQPDPVPPNRTVEPMEWAAGARPTAEDDLAFLPVTELSALVRSRQVSSVELTRMYLDRLHRFQPVLNCVVTFTDDLALRQAEQADREIGLGRYRGPLHGIPWGAKDLIAYPGYPTTWGSKHFRERIINEKATVASRLDQAGAVLLAKLSLGTLAWGDKWFNGMTRNPWNVEQGSSGSSAGSASAVSAGLVGFTLGSETLGSIVSPCRRCAASGLRPTFGRVSRHGCMPLSWSMDKIGPICRSIEDCALVFAAIHGRDDRDPTAVDAPFRWPAKTRPDIRVGYVEKEGAVADRPVLAALADLGYKLAPIALPQDLPVWEMTLILNTEAATVFDTFTKAGETEGLNRWPPIFRAAQFTPAIEYLRANRVRSQLMHRMEELFRDVDLYVDGNDLGITNLTGHPTAVFPTALVERRGHQQPGSTTLTGRLFGEEMLLAVARQVQLALGDHLKRPEPPLAKDESPAEDDADPKKPKGDAPPNREGAGK